MFGTVTVTGNSTLNGGDTATFACDDMFELDGEGTATCQEVENDEDSARFMPIPTCIRKLLNLTG